MKNSCTRDGGFFWVVGFFLFVFCFLCLGGVEFRFQTIFRSRAPQQTSQVPGEQERAASTRGKCPAAEKLEEHPSNRDGQGAPCCCWATTNIPRQIQKQFLAQRETRLSLSSSKRALPSFVLGYPSSTVRLAVDMKQYSHDIWIFLLQ